MADVRGIVEIIMLLPGHTAARVRKQAAELLVRYLGGDLSIIDEVCALRGFQEQLAVHAQDDPRRVFGQAVESAPQNSQILSTIMEKLSAHDQILVQIREKLGQDRQQVNLNVRAPKRKNPNSRFLDEKEREDDSWTPARRNFAPTFSMQVQVLKKKKLREEGKQAVYVEQNNRAQLLYTIDDRSITQAAWDLTRAHREDLAGRRANSQEVCVPRQSVMDMLRNGRD